MNAALFCSKILKPLIVALAIGPSVLAEQATIQEMDNVCANWLCHYVFQYGSWAGSVDPQISGIKEISRGGFPLARAYTIEPAGFVVVPVLKELPAIKAYSTESSLDLDSPEGIGALLTDVLDNRINEYIKYYGSIDAVQSDRPDEIMFDKSNGRTWAKFAVSQEKFRTGMDRNIGLTAIMVGPLQETAWHQNNPYNAYCPQGFGGTCLTGCNALASAQILWYHEWPPAGFGGHKYLWNGDNICGGATPPMILSANYSDSYEYIWTAPNVAELCYEIGVAFNTEYTVCGSNANTSLCRSILPNYYGYKDNIQMNRRSQYLLNDWFQLMRNDIDAGLPVLYTVYLHAIVADGYQIDGEMYLCHMVYGWADAYDAWYTMDNFYCPWPGCNYLAEYQYNRITPDREIMFYSDTISGHVPLEIQFTGMSDKDIYSWAWGFGDGDSAFTQNPSHVYNEAGCYNVSLAITHNEGSRTKTRTNFIFAICDSLKAGTVTKVETGQSVEVVISARNSEPLSKLIIPIEYAGAANLNLDSFRVDGCRTADFEKITLSHADAYNHRVTISLSARIAADSWTEDLAPGSGPVLKVYFTPAGGTPEGSRSNIILDGYSTYTPTFYGNIYGTAYIYSAASLPGSIKIDLICGDANDDEECNLLDILFLISTVYYEGPQPVPAYSGDVNADGDLNLLNILGLIDFIYGVGTPLECTGG